MRTASAVTGPGRSARPVIVVALFATLAGSSCGPGDGTGDPECAAMDDCAETTTACAGCPPMGDSLCLEGTCEARADDAVDVTATVQIVPRQLVVTSLVHVLAATTTGTGPLSCATAVTASGISADVNVLAAGYKALAGGPFHPDVSVGRVPEGDVALLLLGTDGAGGGGNIIATGCVESLAATAPEVVVDVVNLNGL